MELYLHASDVIIFFTLQLSKEQIYCSVDAWGGGGQGEKIDSRSRRIRDIVKQGVENGWRAEKTVNEREKGEENKRK
jgi:hypothetical protein